MIPARSNGHHSRVGLAASATAAAVLALGPPAQLGSPPLLVNESQSLPKGLYVRSGLALRHGDVVALRQPAAARPYLASLGAPAEVRLLKRIVATEGEPVCRRGGNVELPGRRLPAPATDRRGRPLQPWLGCRRLAAGEVFLAGDTLASFDSRYFGPVRRAEVVGPYVRVLGW
jgi:type IV secretory pathway protease TraF